MEILMGISILLIVILAVRHCLLLKGLSDVRKQLEAIHEAEETNQIVTNPHNFFELNKLIQEINVDIVRNQENLIQYRVKEQALKEQMTNISHDLRTPLASILGYFELMNDEEATEEETQQYLKMIQKRAKLLQVLLANYYDLARIESDEYPLQMRSIDASAMLAEILATFYYDFSNKNMKVEVIQDIPSLNVLADEKMLHRVFINIIQNVLKHGREECRIVHQANNNQMVTKIMNKISESADIDIEQVFARLYSLDKARSSGSTGIGLTIAHILIEKMGHEIDAELNEEGWFSIIIYWKT